MKCSAYIVLTYGLFVLIGGMIGYAKAHSLPSLIMGGSFAILLIISGVAMLRDSALGSKCALGLSTVLTIFFFYRLLLTQHFMPAGLMTILSLFVACTLAFAKTKCINSKK